MAVPSARSRRTRRNSSATSVRVSEEVGSSMIRMRALIERARAISTICCWAMLRLRAFCLRSRCTPSEASSLSASA